MRIPLKMTKEAKALLDKDNAEVKATLDTIGTGKPGNEYADFVADYRSKYQAAIGKK